MAFGSFSSDRDKRPMAEINMVPMIDVMLVLLIIFIVTAPLLTHAVKVDLPKASNKPNEAVVSQIQIAINAEEKIFWNGEEITDDLLTTKLQEAATWNEKPEIHLHIDKAALYDKVAHILSSSANLGLTKIAFVTDPSQAVK